MFSKLYYGYPDILVLWSIGGVWKVACSLINISSIRQPLNLISLEPVLLKSVCSLEARGLLFLISCLHLNQFDTTVLYFCLRPQGHRLSCIYKIKVFSVLWKFQITTLGENKASETELKKKYCYTELRIKYNNL